MTFLAYNFLGIKYNCFCLIDMNKIVILHSVTSVQLDLATEVKHLFWYYSNMMFSFIFFWAILNAVKHTGYISIDIKTHVDNDI